MFIELSQGEQEEVLHGNDDSIGVGRGREGEAGIGKFLGDDRCGLDEEGFAAVRGEAVLDEVEEAAQMLDRRRCARRHCIDSL